MSGPSEPAAAKVVDGEVFDVETEGPALVDGLTEVSARGDLRCSPQPRCPAPN